MYSFSTDPNFDDARQEALSFIRSQIITMIESGEKGVVIDQVVYNTDLKDIHTYMKFLKDDKALPFRIPIIRNFMVNDIDKFATLCDYCDINNAKIPTKNEQRVYFIETSDFAITFIPIELEDRTVNIRMEPLDESPDFILEMWDKVTRPKDINDIDFVDFSNRGD